MSTLGIPPSCRNCASSSSESTCCAVSEAIRSYGTDGSGVVGQHTKGTGCGGDPGGVGMIFHDNETRTTTPSPGNA